MYPLGWEIFPRLWKTGYPQPTVLDNMLKAVGLYAFQVLSETGDALLPVAVQELRGPVKVGKQPRHLFTVLLHVCVVCSVFNQTDNECQDDKLVVAVPRA